MKSKGIKERFKNRKRYVRFSWLYRDLVRDEKGKLLVYNEHLDAIRSLHKGEQVLLYKDDMK